VRRRRERERREGIFTESKRPVHEMRKLFFEAREAVENQNRRSDESAHSTDEKEAAEGEKEKARTRPLFSLHQLANNRRG
jgi:hypothetical protein